MVSPADREQQVSTALVALADTLTDDYDILGLLDQLVAHSVALLSADAAGLLLADAHGQLRPATASSPDAQTIGLLEIHADEGPGLEAYQTGSQVRVPDLAQATARWPRFTTAAAQSGAFASVHALPLQLRREAIGVLTLLHRAPGPLPAADLALGQALVDVATIGILSERKVSHSAVLTEQLQTALNSRVIIEQAKGVLSERLGVGMDAAFDLLRRHTRSRSTCGSSSRCRPPRPGRPSPRSEDTTGSSSSRPPECWPSAGT